MHEPERGPRYFHHVAMPESAFPGAWADTSGSIVKLWLIFAVMYFFELASFPLSIDEERAALRHMTPGSVAVWAQQGRWGAYLFERFIFSQPTLPFLPAALFGFGLVIAYVIFMEGAGLKIGKLTFPQIATFGIFCGYPTWVFIIEFYSNAAAVGLGVALSSTAVWILSRGHHLPGARGIFSFILAACSAAFAISMYQSLLFLVLAFGIAALLFKSIRPDARQADTIKNLFSLALCLIISFVLYKLLDRAFLSILNVKTDYADQFIQFNVLLTNPLGTVRDAFQHMQGIYGFKANLYLTTIWSVPIVLALGTAGLLASLWNAPPVRIITVVLLATLLLISPFIIDLVSRGLPTRSVVSAPFVVWCFAYLALHNRFSYLRLASIITISIGMFQFLIFANSMSASSHFSGIADQLLASRLYDRISMASPMFSRDRQYQLLVYGGIENTSIYPVPPSSTVGGSFFGWDGGNPSRMVSYLAILGFDHLKVGSLDTQNRYLDMIASLPVWPAPGSVKIDDAASVIMVRLGKDPSSSNREAEMLSRPIPLGSREINSLFNLDPNNIRVGNAGAFWSAGHLSLDAGQDPMLFLNLINRKAEMATCHKIQIGIRLTTDGTDQLQVFYQTPLDDTYSETRSQTVEYSRETESYLFMRSSDGFGTELRIDPGNGNSRYDISALEVRCLD